MKKFEDLVECNSVLFRRKWYAGIFIVKFQINKLYKKKGGGGTKGGSIVNSIIPIILPVTYDTKFNQIVRFRNYVQ